MKLFHSLMSYAFTLTTTLAGTPMNHADPTRKHYIDYRYDSEGEALHMETCLDIKAGQEVFCSYSKVFFPCPWYDKVMTEAGLIAIRNDRDYVLEEDMLKATRKLAENKKMESKLDYSKV